MPTISSRMTTTISFFFPSLKFRVYFQILLFLVFSIIKYNRFKTDCSVNYDSVWNREWMCILPWYGAETSCGHCVYVLIRLILIYKKNGKNIKVLTAFLVFVACCLFLLVCQKISRDILIDYISFKLFYSNLIELYFVASSKN